MNTAMAVGDHNWQQPDPVLRMIVNTYDSSLNNAALGITIMASGLVITGSLIPAWLWFEEIGAAAPGGLSIWQLASTAYRRSAETLANADPAAVQQEKDRELRTNFIHLAEAQVVTPMGLTEAAGGRWRCRLTEVTAWMPATISAKSGSSPLVTVSVQVPRS